MARLPFRMMVTFVATVATVGSGADRFDRLDPADRSMFPYAVDAPAALVNVPDDGLRKCMAEALGKSEDESFTRREVAVLHRLRCVEAGVTQLSGIEYAENLEELNVSRNRISDLAPLVGLTEMRILDIDTNRHISDLTPLAGMSMLWGLRAGDNQISDLTPLSGLTALIQLSLNDNRISDLTPLKYLTALKNLGLSFNQISDLTPLVANRGLGQGDWLGLERNVLSQRAVNVEIPELLERGVRVSFDPVDPTPDGATVVEFSDPALERVIRRRLRRGEGWPITADQVSQLTGLVLADLGIEDLTGLEFATGLERLDLSNNRVVDLTPLAGLTSLWALWLSGNPVSDISSIAGLPSLRSLTLDNTEIENLAPLAGLRLAWLALDGNSLRDISALDDVGVGSLSLGNNEITDISVLADNWSLRWLSLNGNAISSLAPLAALGDSLTHLDVRENRVSDLSPLDGHGNLEELLAGTNLISDLSPLRSGKLAFADLSGNPLGEDAISEAEALRGRGATVLLGHVVPYFPAAGGGREGFVRVVNRGNEVGDVFIEAIDDAGERFGPVRLPVGPLRATHLNSEDLERGKAAKGLSAGLGPPTKGDWRLEFTSPLDIEVLSYVRTEDGFVTAMHDVAADSELPFFNPGANTSQRSILRVVNTEAGAAKLQTGGHDDGGAWMAMSDAVLVKPGHTFTATAQALEQAHGLGDGDGKWRLRVPEWPWLAMSLLESPTGHLSNLSTAPANMEWLADGMARHHVPLFLAAGASREGFLRVINRSERAGAVEIEGIDDGGRRSGPIRLSIADRETAHFNSGDLENGNAEKGLSLGLGRETGDWRLALTTALDIQVLAYVRTADGFLTAMHDLAPLAEDGGHRVVFFNPGSNTAQVSELRLMNDGDEAAQVTITGIDDAGAPSETVGLTLAGRRALTLTAAQLESGGEGISGRLGDGTGKWRLRVHSDAPLAVMSLLESPTGHLANLSTATAKTERNPWPVPTGLQPAPPQAQKGYGTRYAVDFDGRGH